MMTVQKKTLDELIRVTRKYYKTGDTDLLALKNHICNSLSEQAYNNKTKWIYFGDMVDSLINLNGRNTNQTVYTVFEAVGIKVKGDDGE